MQAIWARLRTRPGAGLQPPERAVFAGQGIRPCPVGTAWSAGAAGYPLSALEIRRTWDALAAAGSAAHVGDPATGAQELKGLFGRLGADPRGGVCVEVGCGPGRMTGALAERFDKVVAADVSPAMLERARGNVVAPNVTFHLVSGERLDGLEDGIADVVICYLVLQHLPGRRAVLRFVRELGRLLGPTGEAFVQLPVLGPGLRPRLWRLGRAVAVPVVAALRRDPEAAPAFRGFRLTRRELEAGLAAADLRAAARDEGPSAYRWSRDVFLRLRRA